MALNNLKRKNPDSKDNNILHRKKKVIHIM